MGGYGSGRRTSIPAVEECVSITLADLKAWDMLKANCMRREYRVWTCRGRETASFEIVVDIDCMEPYPMIRFNGTAYGRKIKHDVFLDAQPMRFGGVRWYALCPHNGKRCTTLVLRPDKPIFMGRMSTKLPNQSQREGIVGRAQIAGQKAQDRLKALSKYARTPTKQRLRRRMYESHAIVDEEIERVMGLMGRRLRGRR